MTDYTPDKIINDVLEKAMNDKDITSVLIPESRTNLYIAWGINDLADAYGIPQHDSLKDRAIWIPVSGAPSGYVLNMATVDVTQMVQLKNGLIIGKDLAELANQDYVPNVVRPDPYLGRFIGE